MSQLTGTIAMVRSIAHDSRSNAELWIKVEGHDWQHYKNHPALDTLPPVEYIPKDAMPWMETFMQCIQAGFNVIEGVVLSADDLPQ